ncbi:hypothetical protein T11_5162, partial [Trichinella zimbabwensis]
MNICICIYNVINRFCLLASDRNDEKNDLHKGGIALIRSDDNFHLIDSP